MGSLKILVVDDESRMRKLVKDFLVKQGYTVLEAGDGSEALDIFYENQDIGRFAARCGHPPKCRLLCLRQEGTNGMSCRASSLVWMNILQSRLVRKFLWRA